MAKSVALERQLATAALWVRIQTPSKIINGRHKRRSGRHNLAHQKNIQKNIPFVSDTPVDSVVTDVLSAIDSLEILLLPVFLLLLASLMLIAYLLLQASLLPLA